MFYVAQILSAIGGGFLLYSTFSKEKNGMLRIQILDASFNALACLLLGAWTGVILNLIAVIRNATVCQEKMKNWLITLLMGVTVVTAVYSSIGWLPLIASLEYTVAVSKCRVLGTKVALALNVFLWACYSLQTRAYPAFIADCLTLACIIYTVYKMVSQGENSQLFSLGSDERKVNDERGINGEEQKAED